MKGGDGGFTYYEYARAGEHLGAYTLPGDHSVETAYYRAEFLDVVARARPAVLKSLEEAALATFRQAIHPELGLPEWGLWPNGTIEWLQQDAQPSAKQDSFTGRVQVFRRLDIKSPNLIPVARTYPGKETVIQEGLRRVEGILSGWGDSWALSDDWILETALLTLLEWSATGVTGRWSRPVIQIPYVPLTFSGDTEESRTRFVNLATGEQYLKCVACDQRIPSDYRFTKVTAVARFDVWRVSHETRKQAYRRILDEIRGDVKEHLDQVDTLARARGLRAVVRKRAADHFDWLVRFQVPSVPGGPRETEASIAKDVHADLTTVQSAIRKGSSLIRLTRRSIRASP